MEQPHSQACHGQVTSHGEEIAASVQVEADQQDKATQAAVRLAETFCADLVASP